MTFHSTTPARYAVSTSLARSLSQIARMGIVEQFTLGMGAFGMGIFALGMQALPVQAAPSSNLNPALLQASAEVMPVVSSREESRANQLAPAGH